MAYSYNATLLLGSSQIGLTLKAALIDTTGIIHAVHRDITTGFVEIGVGIYSWVYASVPDSYRGSAVYYTGVLGVAGNFAGVTLKTASSIAPEEFENVNDKTTNIPIGVLTKDYTSMSGIIASGLSGRCLLNATRKLVNAFDVTQTSGYISVYQEDDVSVAFQQALTYVSGAIPITALNTR